MYTAHIRCLKVGSSDVTRLHSVQIARGELADVHALCFTELEDSDWKIDQILVLPGGGITEDIIPSEVHGSIAEFVSFYRGIRFRIKK